MAEARSHITKTTGDDARVEFAVGADGRPLGAVAALLNRRMRAAWVSYWLVEDARGRGLAARALVALADWLFAREDVFRLELHRLNHSASQRVAERAGFVREGIMRAELECDGVRADVGVEECSSRRPRGAP